MQQQAIMTQVVGRSSIGQQQKIFDSYVVDTLLINIWVIRHSTLISLIIISKDCYQQ